MMRFTWNWHCAANCRWPRATRHYDRRQNIAASRRFDWAKGQRILRCPDAIDEIGHLRVVQELRIFFRFLNPGIQNGPDLAADEWSHLRPGDAMDFHCIGIGRQRNRSEE